MSVLVFGCKGGKYIEDYVNVKWSCEVPTMEFVYKADNKETATGTIVKGEESIDIVCLYVSNKQMEIYDAQEYEKETSVITCAPLLRGRYKIGKNGTAVLTIVEDNLFNGKYLDKEIVLIKTSL